MMSAAVWAKQSPGSLVSPVLQKRLHHRTSLSASQSQHGPPEGKYSNCSIPAQLFVNNVTIFVINAPLGSGEEEYLLLIDRLTLY